MLEYLSKGIKKMIFLPFKGTSKVIYLVAVGYLLFEKANF